MSGYRLDSIIVFYGFSVSYTKVVKVLHGQQLALRTGLE